MKKIITWMTALALVLSLALPVSAADGKVTYDGDADKFIFAPGSDYSPTDLFPNFKSVMPGDQVTQKITVKNDPSHDAKVKIYIRSLGAHEDSVEFLSQMRLRVEKSADNDMGYMFDAAADQSAQLTDWVYLGTLYSGGEVNLDVILDVPAEMDNNYSEKVGYLDWEFKIEKFPVEDTDPNPDTSDFGGLQWFLIAVGSVFAVMLILVILRRRKQKEENQNV